MTFLRDRIQQALQGTLTFLLSAVAFLAFWSMLPLTAIWNLLYALDKLEGGITAASSWERFLVAFCLLYAGVAIVVLGLMLGNMMRKDRA